MGKWIRDEEFAKAVAENKSVAGVLKALGRRPTGGSHNHASQRIKRLGLDTSHFTGQGWRAGRTFSKERKTAAQILVVKPEGSYRQDAKFLRRAMLEVGVEHKCQLCGNTGTWNDLPLTLEIDHVDGNWLDSRIENLRFLCPNCHQQQKATITGAQGIRLSSGNSSCHPSSPK
jgi:Zn finger protein HypA/HybF involved in hydrogenase expression